jgi:hypothetical protein
LRQPERANAIRLVLRWINTAGGLAMPRRHSYMMRFRCPKCHRAGTAKWEEHERLALPHSGQTSVLKSISDGFRAGPQHEITCAACNVRVVFGRG